MGTSHRNSEEKFQLTGIRSLYLSAIGWLNGKLKNFSVSLGAICTSYGISEELVQPTGFRSLYLAAIGWLQGKRENFPVS